MTNEIEESKYCCKTCKYYRQHYSLYNDRFLPIHCAHCVCPELHYNSRTPLKLREQCDFWEQGEGEEEERKRIKDILRDVEMHLKVIEKLLGDE